MAESQEELQVKAHPEPITCTYCDQVVFQGRLFSCKCKHVLCIDCSQNWKNNNDKLECPLCKQEEDTEQAKGILHFGAVRCQDCEEFKSTNDIVWCKLCQILLCTTCDHPVRKLHGIKGHAVQAWNSLAPVADCLAALTKRAADAEKIEAHNAEVLAHARERFETGLLKRFSSGSSGLQEALQTLTALYDCKPSVEDTKTDVKDVDLQLFTTALQLANVKTTALDFKLPPVMKSPSDEQVQQLVKDFLQSLTPAETKKSTASSTSTPNTPNPPPQAESDLSVPRPDNLTDLPLLQVDSMPKWTLNTLVTGTHYDRCVYVSYRTLVFLSAKHRALVVCLEDKGSIAAVEVDQLKVNSNSKGRSLTGWLGSKQEDKLGSLTGWLGAKQEDKQEAVSNNLRVAGILSSMCDKDSVEVFTLVFYCENKIIINVPDSFGEKGYDVGERRIKTKKSISECHMGHNRHSDLQLIAANHQDGSTTICYIDLKNRKNDAQETVQNSIGAIKNFKNGDFCFFDRLIHSIFIRKFDQQSKKSRTIVVVSNLPCKELESLLCREFDDSAQIVGKCGEHLVAFLYRTNSAVDFCGRPAVLRLPEQFKDASLIYHFRGFHLAQKIGHELRVLSFSLGSWLQNNLL